MAEVEKERSKRRALANTERQANQAVAIYARVSTEDPAERETIKSQLDFLRRYVDLHGLPVAGEYVDDGVSGTVPLGERPEGQRLLQDAEAGRIGAVIVYRVDRLGRSLRSLLASHDTLKDCGVAIRSGTEPIDTTTPIGAFIFQLLASLAELEKETISERTSGGRDRVASDGRYTGGPIPFGYDLDEDNRFTPSTLLIPQLDITEAELVQHIFRRVASGEATLNALGAWLSALGVVKEQRYGGEAAKVRSRTTRWGISSLTAIIHNPIYKGEGRVESRLAGEITRPAPALVHPDVWQRAQDRLLDNRRLSKKNAKNDYLLRGLIRCAGCGHAYTGGTGNAGGRIYRCTSHMGRRKVDRCDAKILPADWIEEAIWDECRRFILNPGDALDEARRKLRERMATSTGFDGERRPTLQALAEKETERERVLTMYRKGKIDEDEAERELDAIAKEAGQLRERLESMRAQAALIDASEAFLTESAALLARFRDELEQVEATNDSARKRAVIERYVRQITVETRRVGPRKLEADVRAALWLRPEPIAIESSTCSHGARRWKRLASISRSGAFTGGSA